MLCRASGKLSVLGACVLALSSCLLFWPEPELEPIPDREAPVGEELVVELQADGKGHPVAFTYEINGGGWVQIEESAFVYTFEAPGEYEVTITASNGLRSASQSFIVTVTDAPSSGDAAIVTGP